MESSRPFPLVDRLAIVTLVGRRSCSSLSTQLAKADNFLRSCLAQVGVSFAIKSVTKLSIMEYSMPSLVYIKWEFQRVES